MKRALALLAVMAFSVGCESQADRDKLANAHREPMVKLAERLAA